MHGVPVFHQYSTSSLPDGGTRSIVPEFCSRKTGGMKICRNTQVNDSTKYFKIDYWMFAGFLDFISWEKVWKMRENMCTIWKLCGCMVTWENCFERRSATDISSEDTYLTVVDRRHNEWFLAALSRCMLVINCSARLSDQFNKMGPALSKCQTYCYYTRCHKCHGSITLGDVAL